MALLEGDANLAAEAGAAASADQEPDGHGQSERSNLGVSAFPYFGVSSMHGYTSGCFDGHRLPRLALRLGIVNEGPVKRSGQGP
jgi:hypothetical protein